MSNTILTKKELNWIIEDILKHNTPEWTRFDKKQAWWSQIFITSTGQYRLFKSYDTIVALVNIHTGDFYEIGKYSRTTSKQVTQFFSAFYRNWNRHLVL